MADHLHVFEFNDGAEGPLQRFHVIQAISQVLEFTITIFFPISAIRANNTIHLLTSDLYWLLEPIHSAVEAVYRSKIILGLILASGAAATVEQ